MLIGYMRVSTDSDHQVLDLQRNVLLAAGSMSGIYSCARPRTGSTTSSLTCRRSADYAWSSGDEATENHDGFRPPVRRPIPR
jgi:hypothetical protein